MKLSFAKTEQEQNKLVKMLFWPALVVLLITLWFVFSVNGQTPDATAVNYENVVQSHIMLFKLKITAGLFALGSFVSYGMTHIFTHTELGRCITQFSSKDDSNSKAAKTIALGLVYSATLISVFYMLTSVLGK